MKLGVIGAGKMATALLTGIIKEELLDAQQILVSDVFPETLAKIQQNLGVQTTTDNQQLVSQCDVIFLAVKPDVVLQLLQQVQIQITDQLLISMAAGLDLAHLQTVVPTTTAIIRIMPNLNAQVGAAAIAMCHNGQVVAEQLQLAHHLLQPAGEIFDLPESKFGLFTAISGSSPAFTMLYLDSLARAAVKYGLPKKLADQICTQAILGSAKLLQETQQSPWDVIDAVSSPGGTTVAGLLALEENNFSTAVIKAIDATIAQDIALNQ